MDVRDYGSSSRLAITGHARWRKWNLLKMVPGRQLWLFKYIARLFEALEQADANQQGSQGH
ncbi:hypothetical protein [Fundidesulfovibrio magnetotacticus]|nr:hypothetical protein [Fundidesulfovibrio magnetotacticus]